MLGTQEELLMEIAATILEELAALGMDPKDPYILNRRGGGATLFEGMAAPAPLIPEFTRIGCRSGVERLSARHHGAHRAARHVRGLQVVETGDAAEAYVDMADIDSVAAVLGNELEGGAIVASLDAEGNLVVEMYEGETRVREVLDNDTLEKMKTQRREDLGRETRDVKWQAKNLPQQYADLTLAARGHEIPALKDGAPAFLFAISVRCVFPSAVTWWP